VVCGLVCSTSSGFSSGLLFSVGGFWPQVSILCVCVCVCVCVRVCVAWRIWYLLEVVILLFSGVLVCGVCACSPSVESVV